MVQQAENEELAFNPRKSMQAVKHSTFLGEIDRLYVIRSRVTVQEGMMNATSQLRETERRNANPIKALNDT